MRGAIYDLFEKYNEPKHNKYSQASYTRGAIYDLFFFGRTIYDLFEKYNERKHNKYSQASSKKIAKRNPTLQY